MSYKWKISWEGASPKLMFHVELLVCHIAAIGGFFLNGEKPPLTILITGSYITKDHWQRTDSVCREHINHTADQFTTCLLSTRSWNYL